MRNMKGATVGLIAAMAILSAGESDVRRGRSFNHFARQAKRPPANTQERLAKQWNAERRRKRDRKAR